MKEYLIILATALIAVFTACCLASCKKEEKGIDEKLLYGTWELVSGSTDGVPDESRNEAVAFHKGGNCLFISFDEGGDVLTASTWSLKGNSLTLRIYDGDELLASVEFTIKKISSSEFTIESSTNNHTSVNTYKKCSSEQLYGKWHQTNSEHSDVLLAINENGTATRSYTIGSDKYSFDIDWSIEDDVICFDYKASYLNGAAYNGNLDKDYSYAIILLSSCRMILRYDNSDSNAVQFYEKVQ